MMFLAREGTIATDNAEQQEIKKRTIGIAEQGTAHEQNTKKRKLRM